MAKDAMMQSSPEPSAGPAARGPRWAWAIAPALALLAALPFLPVLGYGFVSWDDDENSFENPSFGGLNPARVRWAWTTSLLGVYQPLAWMLLEAQASLFGLDARGY